MDVILPVRLYNEQDIINSALQLNIDEITALKLVFMTKHCDVDVFETLGDERIQQLLYGWEMCTLQLCNIKSEISASLTHMVKLLAHLTLHLWFSQEWTHCNDTLKEELLIYLDQAQYIFAQIDALVIIDWPYLLSLGTNPWSSSYLQKFGLQIKQRKQHEIEHIVPLASEEDIQFLKQEGILIVYLRLIKLFNASSWESVKQFSLRVLIAWLDIKAAASKSSRDGNLTDEADEKRCLILIGHIYLMTIFVADDNRGYKIDNMMHNIRFYCQNTHVGANTETSSAYYTPARLIAKVCMCLGVGKNEFFEHFVFHAFDLSFTTLFGVISQTYISYVLGNMLMELMAMNEENFSVHLEEFKLIIKSYVHERERSEKYLLNELKKKAAQKTSWATPNIVNMGLDFKSLICKGNRASNFGNYNYDEDGIEIAKSAEEILDEERDRKIDPIFQNIPNNEKVLYYVYDILAKRTYKGWHFGQVVLLLKIIGYKMNKIETWRYHPGLSTEFMLSLEKQLSVHYADLAKIFMEFPFMERELWLTAFYLFPNREYYDEVKRCGKRLIRRRHATTDNDGAFPAPASAKQDLTKFGLLSSTIYVKEIVRISNHDQPNADYEPISKALINLRLPEGVCKDLLTLIFLARNNSFSWALEWHELRDLCRTLIKDSKIKKRFVELDMAEANDRLKFLKIDYEKYKHRPQLDYGTIEEGYEHVLNVGEGGETVIKEDDDDSEFDCDTKEEEDKKPKSRANRRKFWDEESISDEFEEDSNDSEAYHMGSRRTRARTAAVIATAMFKDGRNKRQLKSRRGDLRSTSLSESTGSTLPPEKQTLPSAVEESTKEVVMKKFCEVLETRVHYGNTTGGFEKVTDIWDFAKQELQSVDVEANMLMESRSMLAQLKSVKCMRKIVPKVEIFHNKQEDNQKLKEMHEINKMHALMEMHEVKEEENENEESFQKIMEQDSDSTFRSDTSTQAHKDFEESIYDDDTNDDPIFNNQEEKESDDIAKSDLRKEQPITSDAHQQNTKKVDDQEIIAQIPLDDIKLISCDQDKLDNSSTGADCQLIHTEENNFEFNESNKKDFAAKPFSVRLRRLRADEVAQLRQPRVRVKRLNLDEVSPLQKDHKRQKFDNRPDPQFVLTDECSGNSSASSTRSENSTRMPRRRVAKSIINYKSHSDADDNDNARCSMPKRRAERQLIATTRSASGLKMRISSLKESSESSDQVECIQLSSTSSSPIEIEDCETPMFRLSPIPEIMILDIQESDPLYEEEIVPYR